MNKFILQIKIENELDIVLAYKRAMQLSGFCGIALANQTKFATAVSEICRNVLEHVGQGNIQYHFLEVNGKLFLEAQVIDRGRGIPQVEEYTRQPVAPSGPKGWGIFNSRKLVEIFQIQSEPDRGTKVVLRKLIPHNHPPLNNAIIQGWIDFFKNETDISPYAEIKNQNSQLLELLDQLRLKNMEVEYQLEEIRRLNSKLQTSNFEISELLDQRDKVNRQLQETNQELDRFAHTVSHDLKGPVYNISSLSSIIQECVEENNLEEIRQTNQMIQAQTMRMDRFITDVLLYSTTGRHQMAKTEVDLQVLLREILSSLVVPPHIQVKVDPSLPKLQAEAIYLQQIFANLISNAIKYNNQAAGLIEVGHDLRNDRLQFWVKDNGPGIPLADQDNIFRPYETSSLHRNTSTGLGLSIIDKIIQLKGMAFWVESKGSEGAIFFFTWPASEMIR